MLESEIQSAIVEYLQWRSKDVYFVRNNTVSGKIVRSNGTTGWIRNSKKGAPDLIAGVKCGKYGIIIGWEIKSDKGKQSNFQEENQKQIEGIGGYYFVVRSVEDVEKSIDYVREKVRNL